MRSKHHSPQLEDNEEFTKLCLLYLDEDGSSFNFCRPGTVHKARWMTKILYVVEMVLLEQQIHSLPKNTIATRSQQQKLRIFVNFVYLIYGRWWMTCISAVDAPWHDICLYQDLLKYAYVNCDVFASAQQALKRHLWYLCPEMIPLALFSDVVPMSELQHLAEQLLAVRPADNVALPADRYGTGFGKPKFPVECISSSTRLGDLVSSDSWFSEF